MFANYRYDFRAGISIEDIEASMVLALVAAEALHGETAVQLAGCHAINRDERSCIVDAETPAGRDLNRLFAGFLLREFGPTSFDVRRTDAQVMPAAVA